MNFEKKVRNIYPEAKPYMGVIGWGICSTGIILAAPRFPTVSAAWRHAWHCVSAEENSKAVK